MRIPSPAKKRARIEIIPLIDIVFFLLATFVMVSLSMVKNQGISVNLPVTTTQAEQKQRAIITISIKSDGSIYLDKTLVSFDQMIQQLKTLKRTDPDLSVLINGDEKAFFGQAIKILDAVRNLGISKVSVRTKTGSK